MNDLEGNVKFLAFVSCLVFILYWAVAAFTWSLRNPNCNEVQAMMHPVDVLTLSKTDGCGG